MTQLPPPFAKLFLKKPNELLTDEELIATVADIFDNKTIVEILNGSKASPNKWTTSSLNNWRKRKNKEVLAEAERTSLLNRLPTPRISPEESEFRFIDLFAGIGGLRKGFEENGGLCVFTSEWDSYARRTYKANYADDNIHHRFASDIRDVTLSNNPQASQDLAYISIDTRIPDHDLLLAGFPCQPFSSAGLKKGFECDTQGTLFFDVARIIAVKKPVAFVLENVKNLKSHDKGKTFKTMKAALDELGYDVLDTEFSGNKDPKIINSIHWVPQKRERIVLVGFRRDLKAHEGASLTKLPLPPASTSLASVLDSQVDAKYTLTPKLWAFLRNHAQKHKSKGNGFGYRMYGAEDQAGTLSARYYKDGSEILINQGWDDSLAEDDPLNIENRPRRLTPLECSRLMGFNSQGNDDFVIPVSDTQAYKQFGNSVVVPQFAAIAKYIKPFLLKGIETREALR